MATLTVATLARTGIDIAGTAATAAGDEADNTYGDLLLLVTNGSVAPITVTIDFKPTVDSCAVTDPTVTVAAGVTKAIGPFPTAYYNDSTTKRVKISYSDDTSVTVKALKMSLA